MDKYSVKALSKLAGVSVKTLHHYDKIGLLKPNTRTEARYRLYGPEEILRLQQILFYKELDFPLQEIRDIMDDPDYDMVSALSNHKDALKARRQRIDVLINTIDKTINHQLKQNTMKPEELYEGLPKETARAYRKEAIKQYGQSAVETSEKSLMKLSKAELSALKREQQDVTALLFSLANHSPESENVQAAIERHYIVTRKFWGTFQSKDPQLDQYAGLGQLYENDERFTMVNGQPQPKFATFLKQAMYYYANQKKG